MSHFISPTNQPWQANLRGGAIVSFRFPHETEGRDRPKIRPSLVLAVRTIGDQRFALLAYGTTHFRKLPTDQVVSVLEPEELVAASLHEPTQLNSGRTLLVSLENSGFDIHPTRKTPVLGTLTGRSAAQLGGVRKRLEASPRKTGRRAMPWSRRRERCAVTVERRRGGRTISQEQRDV